MKRRGYFSSDKRLVSSSGLLLAAAAAAASLSVSLPVANAFLATTTTTTTGPYEYCSSSRSNKSYSSSSRIIIKQGTVGSFHHHRHHHRNQYRSCLNAGGGGSDTTATEDELESKLQQEQPPEFDPHVRLSSAESNTTTTTTTSALANNANNNDENNNGAFGADLGIWSARALLLLVAVIWGTNFASVKYFEGLCFHPPCHHPPSEAAFARFGIAALVSFPLLLKQRKDVILAGFECGMSITLGYVTQAVALSTISSGKCAFICSLTVIVVPILAALFYGKPAKITDILAALIALAGVSVLEGMVDFNTLLGIKPALADTGTAITAAASSSSIETAASGTIATFAKSLGVGKGDIIALGQPLGFGYTFLRIEHYQEKFKDVPNRVLTIAAAQCVAVGVLAFLWVLYDFNWTIPDFSYMIEPHRLVAIGWTGIVTTVVAIFLEGIALQTATATDAAITFATEPVWACLFGFLLLHEKLNTNSYIGGSIILLACLVGALSDYKLGQAAGEEGKAVDVTSSQPEEHSP